MESGLRNLKMESGLRNEISIKQLIENKILMEKPKLIDKILDVFFKNKKIEFTKEEWNAVISKQTQLVCNHASSMIVAPKYLEMTFIYVVSSF